MPLRWYFISVVLRFKPSATKARKAFRQRQPVEENWEIHRATSLAAARAKAKKAAKVACATPMTNLKTGEKGLWTFVGIKECWLIYDDLADGCEIAWVWATPRVEVLDSNGASLCPIALPELISRSRSSSEVDRRANGRKVFWF